MNETPPEDTLAVDEASVVLYTKQAGAVFPKPPTIEELRAARKQVKDEAKTNPVPRARISWKQREQS